MHLNSPQEESLCNEMTKENSNLVDTFRQPCLQQNRIIQFKIENYWQSLKHSRNGASISKEQLTKSQSIPITTISGTSRSNKGSHQETSMMVPISNLIPTKVGL